MNKHSDGVILLAAGKARRFGSDKRLAIINGQTLLQTTLQTYQALPCELLLVLNFEPAASLLDMIPATVRTAQAPTDQHWGMGDSIALGARFALAQHWQRCLIALADMPFVREQTMLTILDTLKSHDAVVPSYKGQWGHPVGFAQGCFSQLAELSGERGAKPVLKAARPFVLEVDDPGILADIDVPADLPGS